VYFYDTGVFTWPKTSLYCFVYDWRGANSNDKLLAKAEFDASEVFRSPGHMQMKEDESRNNGAQ